MRGQGATAKPALVRVDGAGAVTLVPTDALSFTSVGAAECAEGRVGSADAVADAGEVRRRPRVGQRALQRRVRLEAVVDSRIPSPRATAARASRSSTTTTASSKRAPRCTRSCPTPSTASRTSSALYTCTPLVKFPVAELKPNSGSKYRGTTIAELGAGNRPIDMIV